MLRYPFAIGLAGLIGLTLSSAPQDPCGGTPTDAQLARRRTAISIARQINSAESQVSAGRKYVPLPLLRTVRVPEGFDVQVSTDGDTYAFSVKDSTDRCQAVAFSDQQGVIYTGMPLR